MQQQSDEVSIYAAPWVPGYKAIYYRGLIEIEDLIPWHEGRRDNDGLIVELYERLASAARELGCNAIVGFEIAVDPFAKFEEGEPAMRIGLSGAAVQLQSTLNAASRKHANQDRVAMTGRSKPRLPEVESDSREYARRYREARRR